MKVIIDCDPGNGVPGANVDDGLALALAFAAHDRLDVEAVTIVAGNTDSRTGYLAARSLLDDFEVDVPLYLGAERPLVEDPERWRSYLDRGADDPAVQRLWRGTPRPRALDIPPGTPAAQAIGEIVLEDPGAVTIVAIGPLTNIALALRLFPSMAKSVARIVVMGGVFDVDGYLVDTNFGYDPEAAAIVLGSGAPTTLVPMDVTTRTILTRQDLDRLEMTGGRLASALVPSTRPWIEHVSATRNLPGMWIHDVVAVAVLLDPAIATARRSAVAVELGTGVSRGRTIRWTPGSLQRRGDNRVVEPPAVEILVDIDVDRLMRLLFGLLSTDRPARITDAAKERWFG